MRALVIGCVLAVVIAGCGHDPAEHLPAACSEGPAAVLHALSAAPGHVAIGGTPISRCFNRDATGDDIQILGTSLLAAAQQLGDRARGGNRVAALRLGYLVGAARRGAQRNGLGAEIVRRIEVETSGLAGARAAYSRGLRAGLAAG